jgi:prepilin-type N-terminal cleavage/methylation domain-containing protein/prepilin-type processing-associated H-X9-DG protein
MVMSMKRSSSRHGFTLVELLTVLAIVSVLAAILFAVFTRVRENGRRAVCLNNMKQMSLGMLQYIQDNDSRFPPLMGNFRMTLMPYAGDSKVFLCPAGPQVSSQEYSSYDRMEWVTEVDLKRGIVYGKHESQVADTTTTISLFELIGDAEEHQKITSTCSSSEEMGVRHLGGVNYAFVDGHVKWFSAQQASDVVCFDLTQRLAKD